MAGEIEPRALLLHAKLFHGGEFINRWKGRAGILPKRSGHIKKTKLAIDIAPLICLQRFHHNGERLQHLPPVGIKPIQSTAFDEALQRAAVDILPPIYAFTKGIKGSKGPTGFPLLQNSFDKAPAEIFDGEQAETDAAVHHGEALQALIDVRRQDGNMNPAALCNIARNLTRTVEHAREKRSHKLAWVMAFQPCRLISNISIGGGMRFIEGVRCKGGHLIKELVGNFFIHAPLDCSLTLHRAILMDQSIYEIFALLLHDLMLLFGHGAAHNIRAAIGVARQLAEDLHHLLLIDHTAVGDI